MGTLVDCVTDPEEQKKCLQIVHEELVALLGSEQVPLARGSQPPVIELDPAYQAADARIQRVLADKRPAGLALIEVWNKADAHAGPPPAVATITRASGRS